MSYFYDMCDEDFSIDGLDAEDMKALDAFEEVPVISEEEMDKMNFMMSSELELEEVIEDMVSEKTVVIPVVPEMKLEKIASRKEDNGQMAFVF